MAHAIQVRTRAIELLDEGYTQAEVSKILKVGIANGISISELLRSKIA